MIVGLGEGKWEKKKKKNLSIQKTKITASSPITSWQINRKNGNSARFLFSWAPKSLKMVTTAMKLRQLAPWKKSYEKPRQHIKQRHHFADKGAYIQNYGFSSSHVQM